MKGKPAVGVLPASMTLSQYGECGANCALIVGSLQVFDLVWIMTTGGPVNASQTMATYLYSFGFRRFQLGYGSSVAVIIFLVAFTFSLFYQRFILRNDLTEA